MIKDQSYNYNSESDPDGNQQPFFRDNITGEGEFRQIDDYFDDFFDNESFFPSFPRLLGGLMPSRRLGPGDFNDF